MLRQYNRVRATAEPGRCNRALGLLMSPKRFRAKVAEYGTTYNGCGCPDAQVRHMLCKHRIAMVIAQRATQHVMEMIEKEDLELNNVLAY